MKAIAAILGFAALATTPQQASAWGDDDHKTVALIAQHYLTPAAKKKIAAMLAADTDNLTQHDIASEATWADKFRPSHPNSCLAARAWNINVQLLCALGCQSELKVFDAGDA